MKSGLNILTSFYSFALIVLLMQVAMPGFAFVDDTIGIEGETTVVLPRGDYEVKPINDLSPLILRINSVTKLDDDRYEYDLFYMGLEKGEYALADYLERPDGEPVTGLANKTVEVISLLPEDNDGHLQDYSPGFIEMFGGYYNAMKILAILWVVGFFVIWRIGRKKKIKVVEEAKVPEPTLADKLRPLVQSAAYGKLDTNQQARMERLLIAYWRKKLKLSNMSVSEAIVAMKASPKAGELIRAIESWLHSPHGNPDADIQAVLKPYNQILARDVDIDDDDDLQLQTSSKNDQQVTHA